MNLWNNLMFQSLGLTGGIILFLSLVWVIVYFYKPFKGECPVCERYVRTGFKIKNRCSYCETTLIRKQDGTFIKG
jgi:hypothetical protein